MPARRAHESGACAGYRHRRPGHARAAAAGTRAVSRPVYWTRCAEGKCPIAQWTPVPDDVVIREPNRNGAPVLWWRWNELGRPLIYCYAPGPLM